MKNKVKIDYVEAVLNSEIRVRCYSKSLICRLRKLGGRKKMCCSTIWRFGFSNESSLATLLGELRNIGIPMSGGVSGWPPAEVFRYFRSKDMLKGKFKEVIWKSKEEVIISDQ